MRGPVLVMFSAACSGGGNGGGPDGTGETSSTEATPYENLPITLSFQFTKDTYDGKSIEYYVPDNPKGALWVFHGTNGGFGSVTQTEWLEIYNRLVPHGFAILLNESLDRTAEQWDTDDPTLENVDFVRLASVREFLVANTALSEATPNFAIGFSNGGYYVSMFAGFADRSGWDMRGFVAHNAGGYGGGTVPGMYIHAENDEVDDSSRGPAAAEDCSLSATEECPFYMGTEIDLDPRRFARLPAYSLNQSQEIFDELVGMEYVDADGKRLVPNLDQIDALMNDFIVRSTNPSPTLPPTQLRVVWATHRVSSQHAKEETDWLIDHL
jgi:hypothetical protein